MNKTELITAMAAKSGLTKKEAGAALASLIGGIVEALKAGERVAIPSLGTFEVRERAAREGNTNLNLKHNNLAAAFPLSHCFSSVNDAIASPPSVQLCENEKSTRHLVAF